MTDPLTQLIYSGANRNVEHVMVNGRWVLFHRQLQQVGEEDLQAEFRRAVGDIHRRVGVM
jgi:cytosine/adenosine deaminase-related metal-dependent hydrolase